MPEYITPNDFDGNDSQRIQQAVDAAAATGKRLIIPRHNANSSSDTWMLDEAVLLPENSTVELDGCHLQLSNTCRDNFFRSANCGLSTTDIKPLSNIHILGRNGTTLQGADKPRATGDGRKVLGERTFGTDAGKDGDNALGDWRNIGILFAEVSRFSIQNLHIIDSHGWAISMEYCSQGTIRDLSFDSTGKKIIDGKEETILNQDGLDLRHGCHDILIENISGKSGDDLVALTAIPNAERKTGNINSSMISADHKSTFPGIHNIILRNVHGHCAGGHHIVRLLNTGGLPMKNILIDGIIDTSHPPYQSRIALKIGDKSSAYGGVSPLGTTRNIIVNNIISRAKYAVMIGGSLCDSSISNVLQKGGENDAVYFESGAENIRNVAVNNARTVPRDS